MSLVKYEFRGRAGTSLFFWLENIDLMGFFVQELVISSEITIPPVDPSSWGW
jgi:hypothetical protein